MRIEAVARRAYQAPSPSLSGHPSKSQVRELKKPRDTSTDPTEFARTLERAMQKK